MKNIVENIAIILVVIFSVAIVGLIVLYNLIEDESMKKLDQNTAVIKQISQEEKNTNYINNIEGYKDVNIKVDPRKESHYNKVKVQSELTKDTLNTVIESNTAPKPTRLDSIGDAIDKLLN